MHENWKTDLLSCVYSRRTIDFIILKLPLEFARLARAPDRLRDDDALGEGNGGWSGDQQRIGSVGSVDRCFHGLPEGCLGTG